MNTTPNTLLTMPTPSPASEGRAAGDERLNQSMLDRRQVDIEGWDLQIEQFRSNINGLAGDVQKVAQDRLDDLVKARDQGVEQLDQLREATQDNVDDLLEQTESLLEQMGTGFHKLADELKSLVEPSS